MGLDFQPVLLGGDLNCYSVARAFHEAYGKISKVFGRYPLKETQKTRILDFNAVPDLDTDEGLLRTLNAYAQENPDIKKIVLGCTDDYAALLSRNKEELSKNYLVPYCNYELFEELESKEDFYRCCETHGIPYPKTITIKPESDLSIIDTLPFTWPVIVKPSSSIEYWKYPFDGMEKVYEAQDAKAAQSIIKTIYASGYNESIIVQDLIPGEDCAMRVLTVYCDSKAKVKMMCLGNVLLELHTALGRGNHAAILTEYNAELMEKYAQFLESIGFVGFANFDIKYDVRDGEYKAFEINLRQGRSNYYVTGAGHNIAELLVNDWVLQKDLGDPVFCKEESFWRTIPKSVVWNYTGDKELVKQAQALDAAGKSSTSLDYAYDLRLNLPRWIYLKGHYYRYAQKYRKHFSGQETQTT